MLYIQGEKTVKEFIFKTKPWEHQLKALEYLYERDAAALYTDMGTGKTKVMIDLIVNREFKRVLIVCTKKGCAVWEREFQKHSFYQPEFVQNVSELSTLKKVQLVKNEPLKTFLLDKTRTLVFICNYESVWREPFASLLLTKKIGIDCVICDESHKIKSPGSKCSRYLTKIGRRVSHRYLVTGTPMAENPEDIYAQYRFLDPSIFGTNLQNFRDQYENPDLRLSANVGHWIVDKKNPYKNQEELHNKMFSCAFKADSSVELPDQRNIVYKFKISKKAEQAYKELEKEGVLEYKAGDLVVENVLNMSMRKQQILSGFVPVISDEGEKRYVNIDQSRVEILQELLEGLPADEPVVVFARYRKDLKSIRQVCERLSRGCSELSGEEDTEPEWQSGKTSVLAVQYSSGSESVDFTRARYCIYYSHTVSLAQYLQSKKRIHRPGQTRSVVYYHLVAQLSKGTSEDEKYISAYKRKQEVIDYIMEYEQKEKP